MIRKKKVEETIQLPAKAGKKQDTKFKPGSSGNPAGRPQGSRHTVSILLDNLLSDEAEALTKKAIKMALAGDGQTLRALLDRLLPPLKDKPIRISLPAMKGVSDLPLMTAALLKSLMVGKLTPLEAAAISKTVETHRAALELIDLETRITNLETKLSEDKK